MPLRYIGNYLAGRYTPIGSGLDPLAQAEIRQKYARALTDLEVAETNLKMEMRESYSAEAVGYMTMVGRFAEALAAIEEARAHMGEAAASQMEVSTATWWENLQAAGLGTAAPGVVDDKLRSDLALAAANGVNMADGGEYQLRSGDPAITASHGRQLLDDTFDATLKNVPTELGRVDTGGYMPEASVVNTLDALRGDLARSGQQVLLQTSDLTPEQAMLEASTWATERTQNLEAQLGEGVVAEGRRQKAEARELVKAEQTRINDLMDSVGAPESLRKAMTTAQEYGEGILTKGAAAWATDLADMPTGEDMEEARRIIKEGMAMLNPVDPVHKGIADMYSVPGFEEYSAGMGFRSPERAAVYASRNQNEAEVRAGLDFWRNNPGATNVDFRVHMKKQGFPTSGMGRLLHSVTNRPQSESRATEREAREQIRSERKVEKGMRGGQTTVEGREIEIAPFETPEAEASAKGVRTAREANVALASRLRPQPPTPTV